MDQVQGGNRDHQRMSVVLAKVKPTQTNTEAERDLTPYRNALRVLANDCQHMEVLELCILTDQFCMKYRNRTTEIAVEK